MRDDPSPIDDAGPPGLTLVAYINTGRGGSSTAEDDLSAFCARRGFRLVETVYETPGKRPQPFDKRTGGQEALRCIHAGKAQGILVPELDHAFSSVGDAVTTIERWLEEDIAFVCATFCTGRSLVLRGRAARQTGIGAVFAGLGQFHRKMVARKVQAQLATRRLRGDWMGRVPYGFSIVNGRLVEDPVQMKRIVEMKRAHRRGKSYREIAARFGISVATAYQLVNTDLRLLKRGRTVPRREGTGTPPSDESHLARPEPSEGEALDHR